MRCILFACAILFASSSAQSKEVWDLATASGRALGIDYIICKSKGDAMSCLSIGCRGGSYELFSIRNGSGAYEGKTRIQLSDMTTTEVFKADPAGLEKFGMSMSRVMVSKAVIQSLVMSKNIKIDDSGSSETFSTQSLLALMKKKNNICKLNL